jgi:hypothetical protein
MRQFGWHSHGAYATTRVSSGKLLGHRNRNLRSFE